MGPAEAIVGLGVCALVITLFALVFATYSRHLQFKQRRLELEAQARTGSVAGETVAQLEQRVRVLERIVTDDRFELKQQFKDLAR